MDEYKPKVGDRVRVVLEDEVIWIASSYEGFDLKGGSWIECDDGHTVTVEKIEPPVTVFKPGDRLRHRVYDEVRHTIGVDGYIDTYGNYYPAFAHDSGMWELIG